MKNIIKNFYSYRGTKPDVLCKIVYTYVFFGELEHKSFQEWPSIESTANETKDSGMIPPM